MNEQEIISNFKKIFEYKKEIISLQESRKAEEFALAEEYKVNECNKKRNDIALNYQQLVNEKMAQIKFIENALGDKVI